MEIVFTFKANDPSNDLIIIMVISVCLLIWANFGHLLKVFHKKKKRKKLFDSSIRASISFSLLVVSFFGGYYFLTNTNRKEYHYLEDCYINGNVKVTEGIVRVKNVQLKEGHGPGDLIDVGGITFEIDFFVETFGYNKTINRGGLLIEGTYVRIFYCDTGPENMREQFGKGMGLILRIDQIKDVQKIPFT